MHSSSEIHSNIIKSIKNNDLKSLVLLSNQFDKSYEDNFRIGCPNTIFSESIKSRNIKIIDYIILNNFRIKPSLIYLTNITTDITEYLVENYFEKFLPKYSNLFQIQLDKLYEQCYYKKIFFNTHNIHSDNLKKIYKDTRRFFKIFFNKIIIYFSSISNIKKENSIKLYLAIIKFYYRIVNNLVLINDDKERSIGYTTEKETIEHVNEKMLVLFNNFFRKESLVMKIIKQYPLELFKLKDNTYETNNIILPQEIIDDIEFILSLNKEINRIKIKKQKYVIFV
jgi:hypothetical protein